MARCSRRSAATLIDAEGKSQLKSDATRQALEYAQRLVKFYPADAVSYRRRVQQPGADLRQVGADLQPAVRLGGRQARRAGCRGRLLDLPGAVRTEGPLRADAELLLGHLQLQPEQERRQGTDRVPDAARQCRGARHRQRGLRPAALCQAERLQDLGRSRAAEGHGLQLSAARRQRAEAVADRGRRRPRRSRCRSTTEASTTRCSPGCAMARRSIRSSPGRRTKSTVTRGKYGRRHGACPADRASVRMAHREPAMARVVSRPGGRAHAYQRR